MDDQAESMLGLPADQAAALLRAQGVEPTILVTRAPRDNRTGEGVLRVLRVRGGELTCGIFYDPINHPEQK